MKEFLILLAQAHENFRVAELESLADLHGIKVDLSGHDAKSPFLVVKLESCEEAVKLVEKSILCFAVYELYGYGEDLASLHADVKRRQPQEYWDQYKQNTFKFEINCFQGTRPWQDQVDIIESFKYMALEGKIRMKNPELLFSVQEDWDEKAPHPKRMWFGRLLSYTDRKFVDKYDLRRRKYIGTTSFDAELASVTCNIAQLSPGKFMYDPFAGTGSFLVAAGHCGALTVGSDIDVRMIKGKKDATIPANFKQYGFQNRFLDVMTMDFTHNAFRSSLKFDAIVCDPPYGVREGLRVLGSKDPEKFKGKEAVLIDGVPAHLRPGYIPPKKPYKLNALLDDLLAFGADHLTPRGRLCFWMPTANDEFVPNDIPQHPDLELVHNCVQEFNKWSRRLLVYRRRGAGEGKGIAYSVKDRGDEEFRHKYFRGFKATD
ncbi:tRNA (guanine(10)-N2)-methyltransferase [Trichomonascus vanleenenianus]|uniref:tRNA (guanine-N2-)-methyltransferase n=1 Tax=Trichomonascus vanleenenianus TaxID=2268995 RepID=UPI003ECA544D